MCPDVEGTDSDGLSRLVCRAGRSLFLPVNLVRKAWAKGESDTLGGGGTMHLRGAHGRGS